MRISDKALRSSSGMAATHWLVKYRSSWVEKGAGFLAWGTRVSMSLWPNTKWSRSSLIPGPSALGSIATTRGTMLIVVPVGTGLACRSATFFEVCGFPPNHSLSLIACPPIIAARFSSPTTTRGKAFQHLALFRLGRGPDIDDIEPVDPVGLLVDTSSGEDHPIGLVRRMALCRPWSGEPTRTRPNQPPTIVADAVMNGCLLD
jgi:hypothetical protein